jgi:hypothetical protein
VHRVPDRAVPVKAKQEAAAPKVPGASAGPVLADQDAPGRPPSQVPMAASSPAEVAGPNPEVVAGPTPVDLVLVRVKPDSAVLRKAVAEAAEPAASSVVDGGTPVAPEVALLAPTVASRVAGTAPVVVPTLDLAVRAQDVPTGRVAGSTVRAGAPRDSVADPTRVGHPTSSEGGGRRRGLPVPDWIRSDLPAAGCRIPLSSPVGRSPRSRRPKQLSG